jgi:hypothetical protein
MKIPIHTFSVSKVSPQTEEALRAIIGILGDYNLNCSEQGKILVALLGVTRNLVREKYGPQSERDYTDFLAQLISGSFGVDLFIVERKKRRASKNK